MMESLHAFKHTDQSIFLRQNCCSVKKKMKIHFDTYYKVLSQQGLDGKALVPEMISIGSLSESRSRNDANAGVF